MTKSNKTPIETAQSRAAAARAKGLAAAKKRKEEFLGARVPKELRDKVIARAEAVGLPVSILIRKILEQAVTQEQDASIRASTASDMVNNQVSSMPVNTSRPFADVLGWERITLSRDAQCSGCGKVLSAGNDVAIGFSATGGAPVVVCNQCKGTV